MSGQVIYPEPGEEFFTKIAVDLDEASGRCVDEGQPGRVSLWYNPDRFVNPPNACVITWFSRRS
jgi:hypothetical protein